MSACLVAWRSCFLFLIWKRQRESTLTRADLHPTDLPHNAAGFSFARHEDSQHSKSNFKRTHVCIEHSTVYSNMMQKVDFRKGHRSRPSSLTPLTNQRPQPAAAPPLDTEQNHNQLQQGPHLSSLLFVCAQRELDASVFVSASVCGCALCLRYRLVTTSNI